MSRVIGIDEAGRGPWAGPLVAAAVELGGDISGLRDSKQLSKATRHKLADSIRSQAIQIGIGWVNSAEIDGLGLTRATTLAMARSLASLEAAERHIIVDGNYDYLAPAYSCEVMVKADKLVPAVSAASIIAKVARDNYMSSVAMQLPKYGFENHVGYGTAAHKQSLRQYGPSWIHRMSFKPVMNIAKA